MPGFDYLANPQALRVQVARAWAALPAAGAYDAAPIENICVGMDYALYTIRYTRGALNGDTQFMIEVSPFLDDALAPADFAAWGQATMFAAGGVVSGVDTLSNIQRNETELGSVDADAADFVYGTLALNGTVERIRISFQESGNLGAPGSASATVSFGVRST